MAEQQITAKPYETELLEGDSFFINHEGALRQIKKSNAGLASSADLTALSNGMTALQTAVEEEAGAREEADTSIQESLATKAEIDGAYEGMTVGNAEQLVSTVNVVDKTPYNFRTTGGSADVGNREYTDTVVGGTVAWNQLVNTTDTSVTVPSGHKYYSAINDTKTIGASSGTAITINDGTKDNVIDLTQLFGSTIADHIYALEQATAGAGVAWFKALFPKDYYEYNAGELMSVSGVSAHETVGFNAYDPVTGTAKVVGGQPYQITGAYSAISLDGTAITPDASGFFTPNVNGTLTVTGGNSTTTCVHLVWSGYRNGDYEPYVKRTYPLDSTLTLRGVPKLDASGSLYYDGDTYASDGTVMRKYGVITYSGASGENWIKNAETDTFFNLHISLPSAITLGSNADTEVRCVATRFVGVSANTATSSSTKAYYQIAVISGNRLYVVMPKSLITSAADFIAWLQSNPITVVYELATPTTEEAEPFTSPQICDDFGTEEYVTTSIVPVGHSTKYPSNLRDKVQHLPDLASSDGYYAIRQSDHQMSLSPLPAEIPALPSGDGTYVLKATVSGSTKTLTWEVE